MKPSIFKHILLSIFALLNFSSVCYAQLQVTDFLGRELSLEKPAKRVIALAPHIVENVFAAGAGHTLVGASEHSDYPKAAEHIPRVGNSQTLNIESLVALNPDLVITWHSGRAAQLLPKLERLGLKVYASNPKSLDDIPKSLRDYGHLTGYTEHAEEQAKAFETRLEKLKQRYQVNLNVEDSVSVFYQVWSDPLQTLNGQHIVSDILALCGGKNLFADALAVAPRVSIEAVIDAAPSAILTSWKPDSSPNPLTMWQRWRNIPAVKNRALYTVHPDLIHRHSPRILEGAERICEHLANVRKML